MDEFELCNPIGAKRGKYKLTAVYYVIGNLPQRYSFADSCIFLCILVRHQFVKNHDPGYSSLFAPLIADLKLLKTGSVDGLPQVRACIDFISADNLSAHDIFGLQTHFNSGRICRFCNMDYSMFRERTQVSSLTERTEEI